MVATAMAMVARRSQCCWPGRLVTAFPRRQRMVLGRRKVADQSDEITAIPKLLDLLTVQGATVTIDAMGSLS